MNGVISKIKTIVFSTLGKMFLVMFGVVFVLTFLIAITKNSTVAFAFFRSIVSGFIVCVILYAVFMFLKFFLGDIFSFNFQTDKNFRGGDKQTKDEDEYDEFDFLDSETPEADIPDTYNAETEIDSNLDFPISDPPTFDDEDSGVDKNSKVGYHNNSSEGSIDAIIFGGDQGKTQGRVVPPVSAVAAPKNSKDIKIPMDNPEMAAKAVRTMRARDKE